MKRLIAILSLMLVSCSVLSAALVKTSKPVPLTKTQMASVKGQGYFYVWVWVNPGSWNPNGNTLVTGYSTSPWNVYTVNPNDPSAPPGGTYPAGGSWSGGSGGYYTIGAGSGPCSFDGYIYIGGPLAGQSKTS